MSEELRVAAQAHADAFWSYVSAPAGTPSAQAALASSMRTYDDLRAALAAPSDPEPSGLASGEELRAALDEFGPMTFGPGCSPFNHPPGCQCPYPLSP